MSSRIQGLHIGVASKDADLWTGAVGYLVLLPALAWIPYRVGMRTDLASASGAMGYNNGAASSAALAILLLVCGLCAARRRATSPATAAARTGGSVRWRQVAAVAVAAIALYFPPLLSRHGPYIEDLYILTTVHRMLAGDRPYRDFEFLYGPLMAYLAYGWMRVFGFSLTAYYALFALIEAVQYSMLAVICQQAFSAARRRWLAFVLISALLFDTMLGLNWSGARRFLAVVLFWILARDPLSWKRTLGSALLVSVHLGYSPDYGGAAFIAGAAMFAFMAARERDPRYVVRGAVFAALTAALWLGWLGLLLRGDIASYFEVASTVLSRFAAGERGFPFYWTLNSLAVFALLITASVVVGRGIRAPAQTRAEAGDRFLFASLVYGLVILKSGLNRADMWHLDAAILPLVAACLLPWPRALFTYRVEKGMTALVVVICGTYFLALFPTGSHYAWGLFRGLQDSVAEGRLLPEPRARDDWRALEADRRDPNESLRLLATYVSERGDPPVVLYGSLWSLNALAGIKKAGYPLDDILLSDEIGWRLARHLSQRTGALLLIRRDDLEALSRGAGAAGARHYEGFYRQTPMKSLLSWLSTVHYRWIPIEVDVMAARWERTVGSVVRSEFRPVAEYGGVVVMEKRGM